MTSIDKGKVLVLVVDDDIALCGLIRAAVSEAGYESVEAHNAVEAELLADQNRSKIIPSFIDINIPGEMNGIELITQFKRTAPHIAMYAMTGEDREKRIREEAIHAGALYAFEKTYDKEINEFIKAPKIGDLVSVIPVATEHVLLQSFTQNGLWNRRVFFEKFVDPMMRAMQNRQQPEYCSFLFLDIDDFKKDINDKLGHGTGDRVIEATAQVLKKNIRGIDHACHPGGDEFWVFLPGANRLAARKSATHIIKAIRSQEVISEKGIPFHFSATVGIATIRWSQVADLQNPAEELKRMADVDLKARKLRDKVGR